MQQQKLLVLNSSILGDHSVSNRLTAHYAKNWRRATLGSVTVRDLTQNPVPHLKPETLAAWSIPAEERSSEQKYLADMSDELINQVREHDVMVIGAPMYNFSVPVELKNVQDNLARAGITFRYTEEGPEGLLGKGKKLVIIHTRGGVFKDTPADSVTPMMENYFGMLGFEYIHYVWAEGLSMGDKAAEEAIADAIVQMDVVREKQAA